jgi:hypothetical protein
MTRRKRKCAAERPRVVVNGVTLSARQERCWRTANDDVDSGDDHRIRRGLSALAAIELELAAEQSALAVQRGLADTLALERGRGEQVDASSDRRIRIRTRDGLETLVRTGAIDAAQQRAGLLYRDLYEAADPERDLKSHMQALDRLRQAAAPSGRAEAWAERRLRLSGAMAALEAKVRDADRNDLAVRALREVAGHARCISHLVQGGGAQARYRRALVLALDVCVEHFGLR